MKENDRTQILRAVYHDGVKPSLMSPPSPPPFGYVVIPGKGNKGNKGKDEGERKRESERERKNCVSYSMIYTRPV